jgi:hypothetical protein
MTRSRALLVALAMLGGFVASAGAEDRIWTGLVLATNERPPKPTPKLLEPFVPGLKAIFGYNTLYLLGEKRKAIRRGSEEWLVPSEKLYLKMRCTGQSPTAYTVQLELYLKKSLMVTSEVKLARDAPLYIRGPQWGQGQLVFILEVQ